MSKVITTKQQYALLLELLQQKPEMAQGFSKCPKEVAAEFWSKVADELNSVGPPHKDISSWKKLWLDWKAYIKRKLAENKKEQSATGGGRNRQHHFSELEEAIIKLTALETSTNGIQNTVSVGLSMAVDTDEAEADISLPSISCSPALPRCSTKPPETNTIDLVKEQLLLQKDFQKKVFEKLDDLSSDMRRLCDLKKAEVEEIGRHNRAMENLIAAKNSIKQQMLQVEQ
ncbi:uncharacterized protein LOC128923561 isoform X1 [Zeugodacus cucurbitae]|uniref:uncharacterized protein LOC128923561 isoform X1 n=2 Tax=Zeugodacus cucurbitae TaxID=28588 RepID=UPI0023D8F113|nr:uncharacterized protein LOC128923561 isoform X1 [Zeugodacus cucurbitae]